jgi:threonine dehydrogenase-like Zn-dependent dehydrogenase
MLSSFANRPYFPSSSCRTGRIACCADRLLVGTDKILLDGRFRERLVDHAIEAATIAAGVRA